MRRKLKMLLVTSMAAVMMCSMVSLAGSTTTTKYNGDVALTCYINCTTSSGKAATSGAPSGYYQRANITIYNSSGTSLGNASSNKAYTTKASASVSSTKTVSSALSGHFLSDSSGNAIYPLYKQIQLSETP